jgi:hypothetical protein
LGVPLDVNNKSKQYNEWNKDIKEKFQEMLLKQKRSSQRSKLLNEIKRLQTPSEKISTNREKVIAKDPLYNGIEKDRN